MIESSVRSKADRQQHSANSLANLPLEHLEHEICELSAHIEAGMAHWLSLVGEYDEREGWGSWWGVRSTAEWIAWRCSVSPRAAREHVRVARALRELPTISDAFSRGELSYSKVRPLTRVATAECEADLIELARYATAAQLERMLRAYRRATRDEANAAWEERHLSWFWDDDGSLVIRGRLPAEEGMAFLRAVDASRTQLREEERASDDGGSAEPPTERGSAEPPPPLLGSPPTNADALARIAESYIARGPTERAAGDRHQVIALIDAETLVRDGPGRSELGGGPAISPEVARRLGCDGSLSTIVKRGRKVLSVGRKTRAIPAAMDRALRERDGGCRFPGCERTRYVDAHHIRHWAHGGETSLENLVLLCRHHHRLVHEGGFSLERGRLGRLVFRDPRGNRLEPAPAPGNGDRAELRRRNHRAGLEIDAETLLKGTGEKMDLPACVDGVFDITHPRPGRDRIYS